VYDSVPFDPNDGELVEAPNPFDVAHRLVSYGQFRERLQPRSTQRINATVNLREASLSDRASAVVHAESFLDRLAAISGQLFAPTSKQMRADPAHFPKYSKPLMEKFSHLHIAKHDAPFEVPEKVEGKTLYAMPIQLQYDQSGHPGWAVMLYNTEENRLEYFDPKGTTILDNEDVIVKNPPAHFSSTQAEEPAVDFDAFLGGLGVNEGEDALPAAYAEAQAAPPRFTLADAYQEVAFSQLCTRDHTVYEATRCVQTEQKASIWHVLQYIANRAEGMDAELSAKANQDISGIRSRMNNLFIQPSMPKVEVNEDLQAELAAAISDDSQ
jgi:hypothetical protein